MGRQEFDAAEKYAKQSEAIAGTLTFMFGSDSPAKALKELKELKEAQQARSRLNAMGVRINPAPKPSAAQ